MNSSIKTLFNYTKDLKVLYVEDDESLLLSTKFFLEDLFLRVDTAINGEDGLIKYKDFYLVNNEFYDFVLTDINMPILDGVGMIREIKKIHNEQVIVVASAHNESDYFLKVLYEGIDGYILKPLDLNNLIPIFKKVSKIIHERKELKKYKGSLEKIVKSQTEKIERQKAQLEQQLQFDQLTKLKNSTSFFEKLHDISGEEVNYSTVLFDIWHFDHINNVYGMEYGDLLLRKVANYLVFILKDERYDLFRLESDKFILTIESPYPNEEFELIKLIFRNFESKKFEIKDIKFKVIFTVGILKKVHEADRVVSKLKVATREIKENFLNNSEYRLYDPESPFVKKQEENLLWMHRIREVIANNTVYPVFQPIYDNKSNKIAKYEVLMRIEFDNNIISPFHFLEPARLLGLLPDLTKIIIEKAFKKFSRTDIQFTINISEEDLRKNYLADYLDTMLKSYDISSKNVTLEILENMTTKDDFILKQLELLREQKFQLAIDDFGSDNSNFSRLSTIQANIIKIDGKFIRNIDTNQKDLKIVKAIVFLAKELGSQIVAEFVHSENIQKIVKSLDIDFSQGFYLSEPLSENQLDIIK
jgi:diguanylate cyclase (GGDEF)-like protein